MILIPVIVAALIIARLVFAFAPRHIKKRAPSLPGRGWKIVYTDNASEKQKRKPDVVYGKILKDPEHFLQGKPDFIYSNGRDFIPVELKSSSVNGAQTPREGDMTQLAVYFFLIEAEYGVQPKEGRLIYADAMFVIKNTRQIRNDVLMKVREMKEMLANRPSDLDSPSDLNSPSDMPQFAKCRRCLCRGTVCETEK